MARGTEGQMGEGAQSGGVTEQVKGAAQNVMGQAKDAAVHARDAVKEQYEHIRDSASEYYDQGREKAHEWQHNIEQYVHDQPMKSLLIAAGVGVVLGVLWKRS